MSQPTTLEVNGASHLAAEYVYLFIAIITGVLSFATWLIELSTPGSSRISTVLSGVFDFLRVVAVLAGCGYLVRAAEARVERRMDHHSPDEDEIYQRGYAAGFVDCATGRAGTDAHHSATIRSLH